MSPSKAAARPAPRRKVSPMATVAQWVEGARPRTLPNAIAPVLAGWGAAVAAVERFSGASHSAPRALLALVVALALVIGVNYANDYSDGIRGTDATRVGPMRLVGSGAAAPSAVRTAALVSFAVAAVAGLGLVAMARQWWVLALGGAWIGPAWFYTGGGRPPRFAGAGGAGGLPFFCP